MSKLQSVDIHEEEGKLRISVRWDDEYASFFFLVAAFSLYGFSSFIAQASSWGDAIPWMLALLVSTWMLYSTICMLLNVTFFEVNEEVLRVAHRPLPWWRGSRLIGIDEVDQLYIREEKRLRDEEEISIYTLHAILVDGTSKQLMFRSSLNRVEALHIEQKLEEYLGITDRDVEGELPGKQTRKLPRKKRRPARRSYTDPVLEAWYLAVPGQDVEFNDQDWQLKSSSQIDWKNGDSDRFLQLIGPDEGQQIVYLSEHKSSLHAYRETLFQGHDLPFSTKDPPSALKWNGQRYELSYQQKGRVFYSERSGSRLAQQWTYENPERNRHLRIIKISGKLKYYYGELIEQRPPIDRLELEDLPEEEIEFRQVGWKGKDIV